MGFEGFWLVTFDDVVVLFEDLGVTLPGRLFRPKRVLFKISLKFFMIMAHFLTLGYFFSITILKV